ncbi:hypothetical protein V2J09_019353 [Rumex salicifolius]
MLLVVCKEFFGSPGTARALSKNQAISTSAHVVVGDKKSTNGAGEQVLKAHQCTDANGNFTNTSIYKSNLSTLLKSKSPDQVNAMALCRGDVGFSDCHTCLDFVISSVTQLCPVQREAIGWADNCMLRYSNRSLFAVWEEDPHFVLQNGNFTGNDTQLSSVRNGLMDSVKNNAASGDSHLKFATQEARIDASASLYVLMQCTPDLTRKE